MSLPDLRRLALSGAATGAWTPLEDKRNADPSEYLRIIARNTFRNATTLVEACQAMHLLLGTDHDMKASAWEILTEGGYGETVAERIMRIEAPMLYDLEIAGFDTWMDFLRKACKWLSDAQKGLNPEWDAKKPHIAVWFSRAWCCRSIVIAAIANDGEALEYANDYYQSDPEIVWQAIMKDPFAFLYARGPLKDNRQFILDAMEQYDNDEDKMTLLGKADYNLFWDPEMRKAAGEDPPRKPPA